MKTLEQEKDALLQGLEMVEKARHWYHQQLQQIQDQQRHRASSSIITDSEAYPSHTCLLWTKIQEVNQCLSCLISSSRKPDCPACQRVAKHGPVSSSPLARKSFHQQALNVLREQNQLLLKEVSEKSRLISQLEKEKAELYQRLCDPRTIPRQRHQESALI
ncbi:suppressor APC domain-containing protein 1 [Rhinatrema bivittatum]|uniref:suppressor APC domain-containing protein 1 n=1 Tax=Rhinatrema bivittatum TaxID=194408 RepID=UPI00112EF98A|nr:suppressor APC domain-containing protein 1 [Rhinatrema bivittatum]